jgi:hypothetical protein
MRDVVREHSPNFVTEVDKPWSVADVDGGVLHILKDEPDLTVFAFDIKNDNLADAAGVAKVAAAISAGIQSIAQ